MARKVLTTLDVNGPLTLTGAAGTSGQVLTSGGSGATPTWTTVSGGSGVTSVTGTSPIVSSGGTTPAISIDQTALYQGNIYTSSSDYAMDFSGSATGQSMLGSTTRGFTLTAGNTYEFELYAMVGMTLISSTTMSLSFGWDISTVSGSPTTNWAAFHSTSTSTILGASGTATQSRNTGTSVTVVAAVTTGSRYATIVAKGQIRVSGTGSSKIFPKITPSATGDNSVTVYKDYFFKVTRIGSDTVSTLGTWTA